MSSVRWLAPMLLSLAAYELEEAELDDAEELKELEELLDEAEFDEA